MRKKRVLFVCTSARARSPTAVSIFGGMGNIEAKSAGVSKDFQNIVTKEIIQWADFIFVMEEKHKQFLIEIDHSCRSKIRVLQVPDIFYRNQPELKQILVHKMQPYLRELDSE